MINYSEINWAEYFKYDEDSPSGLIWIKNRYAGKTGKTLIKSAGDSAGSKSHNPDRSPKSWEVGFNSKLYKAHRIIYTLLLGKIPDGLVIDHIDGNPFNNRIENLRAIPKDKNHRNSKKPSDNTSGYTGVYWQTMNKGKHLYAVAEIHYKGTKEVKCFGTHQYENPLEEAIKWRETKLNELNQLYDAGYTDRHGQ